jgi:hypothetical protein
MAVTGGERLIERVVIDLCRSLVEGLPTNSASVLVKRKPDINHDGVSVWIVPSNPESATISVDAEDGDPLVGVVVGAGVHIEVEFKAGRGEDEVRKILQAVLHGRLQETVWLVGSEVAKSVGVIDIDGVRKSYRYLGRLHPFRKKLREEHKYAKYSPALH